MRTLPHKEANVYTSGTHEHIHACMYRVRAPAHIAFFMCCSYLTLEQLLRKNCNTLVFVRLAGTMRHLDFRAQRFSTISIWQISLSLVRHCNGQLCHHELLSKLIHLHQLFG